MFCGRLLGDRQTSGAPPCSSKKSRGASFSSSFIPPRHIHCALCINQFVVPLLVRVLTRPRRQHPCTLTFRPRGKAQARSWAYGGQLFVLFCWQGPVGVLFCSWAGVSACPGALSTTTQTQTHTHTHTHIITIHTQPPAHSQISIH